MSLTVDAANLEIMRVDQILEDVNEITDSVASAVEAVDTVTNAPVELVNNVTSRVRNAFKSRRASDESVALGQAKAERSASHGASGRGTEVPVSTADVVKGVVTTSVAAAKEAVADQREQRAEQRAERDEKAEAKRVAADKTSEVAATMADAVATAANADAAAAQQYFTYDADEKANQGK